MTRTRTHLWPPAGRCRRAPPPTPPPCAPRMSRSSPPWSRCGSSESWLPISNPFFVLLLAHVRKGDTDAAVVAFDEEMGSASFSKLALPDSVYAQRSCRQTNAWRRRFDVSTATTCRLGKITNFDAGGARNAVAVFAQMGSGVFTWPL